MTTYYVCYDAISGAIITRYNSDINAGQIASPPTGTQLLKVGKDEMAQTMSGRWTVINGTLTPPPAPTTAQLLAQAQSAQSALVTQGYNAATDYVPVTINGTAYQVDNTPGKQALNLSLAITANAMLQSPVWAASTEYAAGAYCSVDGIILFCSTGGKSGSSAPTPPTTFGTPVTDGTAAWELLGRKVYLQDGSYVLMTPQQLTSAFQQGELYLHQMSDQLESLKVQINSASTVSAVQSVIW